MDSRVRGLNLGMKNICALQGEHRYKQVPKMLVSFFLTLLKELK
jgi:hypothetical protein